MKTRFENMNARLDALYASFPRPRLKDLRDAAWEVLASFGPAVRRFTPTEPTTAEFIAALRKRHPDLTADLDDNFLAHECEEQIVTQDFMDGENDKAFWRGLLRTHYDTLGQKYTDAEFVKAFRSECGNVLGYLAYRTGQPVLTDEEILGSLAETLEWYAAKEAKRAATA